MPIVDGVVVLNSGIRACPSSLRHGPEEPLGAHRLHNVAVGTSPQPKVLVRLQCPHELIGDSHRVVGVLVLNRRDVFSTEVHVVSRVAQNPDLVLFSDLGLDELFDVGVIDVEHHHLCGPTCGTT